MTPATTLADTCAAVRRTAKHEKHPDRAKQSFTVGERTGPIVDLNVSKNTLTRALLLANRFIQTAEAIGWPLTAVARLLVDEEPISFLIEERFREESRDPTPCELAREKREYQY